MPLHDYPPSVKRRQGLTSNRGLNNLRIHHFSSGTMQEMRSESDAAVLMAKLAELYGMQPLPTKSPIELQIKSRSRSNRFVLKRPGRLVYSYAGRAGELKTRFQLSYKKDALQRRYAVYRQKIRRFASLPRGWDSYDAEAPRAAAVTLALNFIDLAEKHNIAIKWVAPTVDDSIMVTLETATVRQEWEFYGSGETAVMIREENGPKRYYDVDENDLASWLPQ